MSTAVVGVDGLSGGDIVKLVYIAGPYSGADRGAVEANIRRAELLAIRVAELGAMPVCPHTNTSHPAFEHAQPYQFWIEGTLELLRRCDAVLVTADWERSSGARGEVTEAMRRGLRVFREVDDLAEWLASKEKAGRPWVCLAGDEGERA